MRRASSSSLQCLRLQVGWPTTLATADRRPFVSRLHEAKQKHMIDMVVTGEIPLRTGAPPSLAPSTSQSLERTHILIMAMSRLHEVKQRLLKERPVTGKIPDHCRGSARAAVRRGCLKRADLIRLHAGAKDFVQEALDAGAKVATIAGTCSTPEEKVAEAALEKLGVGSSDRRARCTGLL